MSFATLMYHEIRESQMFHSEQPYPIDVRQNYEDFLPPPLFVTLENFREQMAYLYENQYHTLTIKEVIHFYHEGKELPKKSVLLTFDDCFQSMALYAYPILKEYQFHATAFVVSGWLNTESRPFQPERSVCLSEDELKRMSDVFEYANHTDLFHTRVDQTVSTMMEASDQDFSQDLDRCNANSIIQAKNVFAYPFGLYSDRNVALLQNKEFLLAFTSEGGRNDRDTDPLRLKRHLIPYFMELRTFQDIVG